MSALTTFNLQHAPGLFGTPTIADLRESSSVYNCLPHVTTQPDIAQEHLAVLLSFLRRYELTETYGFHLIHRHDAIGERMVRVEARLKAKPGTWTKPVSIDDADLTHLHGSHFMFRPGGRLIAYEYREGQPSVSPGADNPMFFKELAEYILKNNLAGLVALEVLDVVRQPIDEWVEYELEGGSTVVLSRLDTNRGGFARATGWTQRGNEGANDPDPDPQPSTHYEQTTKGTHRVFVSKQDLQNEDGLMGALEAANILQALPRAE